MATLLLGVTTAALPARLLADSTGEHSPAATSGDLANGANALACNDALNATYTASNQQQIYSVYGLSIPGSATVTGIQVHLRALNDGSAKNRKLRTSLSWNAGVSYTAELQSRNLRTTYRDFYLGGSTYLWGRLSWTPSEVSDANFRVKVVGRNLGGGSGSGNIQLDCLPVTVFYEIPGAPNLTVAKTANPDPVQPLQNLTYTITYGNTGASTATNTILTDAVPANTTFVSASPAGQVVSAPVVGGTGTVTWNVASVPVGASGAVTMVVKVNGGLANGTQIVNNTYDIKSDQNPTPTAGNPVSTSVQGTILLSLTKSDFPDPVGAGATLTYVLTVTNNSTTSPSTNIVVSEGFDANVTYNSYISSGCGALTFDSLNFAWTIASLAQSATCTITITTTVNSPLAAGVLLVNVADIIDDAGNTASASAVTTIGSCSGSPNGTPCNDGNACTQSDTCENGVCSGSSPVVCTASDQCHDIGTCNPANGVCSNPAKASGSSCNDGNLCTSDDACNNGSCISGSPANCNDNNQCTDDSCNPATGCANTAVQNGIACGNTNVCDGIETCQSGVCIAGTALGCDDNSACTTDACDPTRGCVHTSIAGCCDTDADCGDTSACSINERCLGHACTSDPLPCNDANACTTDSCNPVTGCVHTPVANNTACDDGNVCNGINTCQGGTCQAASAPNCNDGNVCTTDGCDPQTGCTHQATLACCNADADCADNTPCTTGERCVSGQCVSDALDCNDGSSCTADRCDTTSGCVHSPVADGQGCADTDVCNGIERCQSGSCTAGTALTCNDGNTCTADSCDSSTGCHNLGTPGCCTTNADCADTSACTTNERCVAGACTSDPVNCNDSNICTDDSCNPASGCVHTVMPDGTNCSDADTCNGIETCRSGVCAAGTALNCNDGNHCTSDSCDAASGCHNIGTPGCCSSDADCADTSACTINERCVGGACSSDPLNCNDANTCTTDSCNPLSGCVNTALINGSNCSDGEACNGAETCQNGTCSAGPPLSCDDHSNCTVDSCDNLAGCRNAPISGCCVTDADCVDASACTENERCVAGACTSDPVNCNDSNVCTADSCNPTTGCLHNALAEGTNCSDADTCNGLETCRNGTCALGVALNCNDGNHCTTDSCDPSTGCRNVGTPGCCATDADCADSSACTINERCVAGTCTSDPLDCNDSNVCTSDSCNPASGCVNAALINGSNCSDADVCNGHETCQNGSCSPGSPLSCDDGSNCTSDSCDGLAGCHNVPIPSCCSTDADCADASSCTANERCVAGSCMSDPLNCDDGKACTSDSCDPHSGCVHTLVPNGEACGDANFCNGIETCLAGDCVPAAPPACGDANPCTTDTCNPATGCTHTPQANCCFTDGDCVDSDACTVNERCVSGSCTSEPRNCADTNPCTEDSCNTASGCINTALVDSTSCSNGNACDGLETCVGGTCRSGAPPDCDDRNFCTMDSCDNSLGCQHAAVPSCCTSDAQCSDADLCTVNEHCTAAHVCTSDPRTCDDANACTSDSCNPASGCVYSPLASGVCDDGSLCATADSCRAGVCAGTAVQCSDGNVCNGVEACQPETGQCDAATNMMMCTPGSGRWVKTCAAQWYIVNPNNLFGVAATKQWCRQGDPTCDFDSDASTCTFHVAVCFHLPDPRLIPPCVPSDVNQFSLLSPTVKRDPTLFNAMMTALTALPGSTRGTGKKAKDVSFTPALSNAFCTSEVPVKVPAGKPMTLRGKTITANAAKDSDAIKFKCLAP